MKNLIKFFPYLVIVLVFSYAVYSNKNLKNLRYDYDNQAQEIKKIHDEELDKLKKYNEIEKKRLAENIARLQHDLFKNQQDYEKKLLELKSKKSDEEKKLSIKAPIELAQELSDVTGFKVYQ